jgi:hypothetical protein
MVKGVAADFTEACLPVQDKDLLLRHDLILVCAIRHRLSRLGFSTVPASTSFVLCLASARCGAV